MHFLNARGVELTGILNAPEKGDPISYALFAHCFTCSKNLKAIAYISRSLADSGIAVFRFDFTGIGESKGDFSETNFSSNVEDLVAAAEFLQDKFSAPRLLIGHSLGGAAILQSASRIPSVNAVCTIAAPSNLDHLEDLLLSDPSEIEKNGIVRVTIGGQVFNIKKQFFDDLNDHSLDPTIRDLNKALLIFHSPFDKTVNVEHAAHIFQLARHPKSFISLDQADHLLTNEKDVIFVSDMLSAWARRYAADDFQNSNIE